MHGKSLKDWLVGDLAARQHGVVARRQLLQMGLSGEDVDVRLERGRLRRVHRGVYAVGHERLSQRGEAMAAVLACGRGAVLSHGSAAWLHGIGPHPASHTVTVPSLRASRKGIRVVTSRIPGDELTELDGIRATGPSRTIFDLAGEASRRRVGRAMKEAEYRRLHDPIPLSALLERYPRRRGRRIVQQLAIEASAEGITRSELEDRFLELVREAGLPAPATNVEVEGFEVDAVWWDARVVVELDGHEAHGTPTAFEEDRERDRILQAAGWRPVRITWRQATREAEAVKRDLRRLTARAS